MTKRLDLWIWIFRLNPDPEPQLHGFKVTAVRQELSKSVFFVVDTPPLTSDSPIMFQGYDHETGTVKVSILCGRHPSPDI